MPIGMACLFAIQCVIISLILAVATAVIPDDTAPVPIDKSALNIWFQSVFKPYTNRQGTLNATLEMAEANPKIITVRKDGSGNFKTVTDAVKSIPSNNKQRVILDIGPAVYIEKITVDRNKPFVMFYGSPNAMPTLEFGGTARQYGTIYSATLTADSDFFVAINIIVKNTAPRPDENTTGGQGLALRIGGNKATFYNCRFLGFQDTLCDYWGSHFFKDCYIEGTVDFVFGSGKSIYLNTELHVKESGGMTVITAQGRNHPSEDTGFSFLHCTITGDVTGAYLGRPWMEMPRVVFAYTNMGTVVNPVGWSNNFRPERERKVLFGEYKCSGPGSNPSKRVKFSKQLTNVQAKPFLSLSHIGGSKWILPPPRL